MIWFIKFPGKNNLNKYSDTYKNKVIPFTTGKWGVSSANNLGFASKLSERSLINIEKNKRPSFDHWRTPTLIFTHKEFDHLRWSFVF